MIRIPVLLDISGWVGAAVVTAAYGFVSSGWVDGQSRAYQSLNALSGLLLAVNTAWHRAWPSAVVNVIWTGIAVGTLAVGARHRAGRLRASRLKPLDEC